MLEAYRYGLNVAALLETVVQCSPEQKNKVKNTTHNLIRKYSASWSEFMNKYVYKLYL